MGMASWKFVRGEQVNRYVDLPVGLDFFSGKVGQVRYVSGNEYSGACPDCGGDDRFRMFDDLLKPRGWCRKCDVKLYPNSFDGWKPPDAHEIARRAEAARRALERTIRDAQEILAELKRAEPWIKYHDELTDQARMIWEYRGLAEFWQDYWQLGYATDKPWGQSLTIPVWQDEWDVANVKHRLLIPDDRGKYRSHTAGLPALSFVAAPDVSGGTILAVEGEVKAMVTYATLEDPDIQIVGLPGKSPSDTAIAVFDSYDQIILCMDPDVTGTEVKQLAERVGANRTRFMHLPSTMKIDDLITDGALDKASLKRYLQGAHK